LNNLICRQTKSSNYGYLTFQQNFCCDHQCYVLTTKIVTLQYKTRSVHYLNVTISAAGFECRYIYLTDSVHENYNTRRGIPLLLYACLLAGL